MTIDAEKMFGKKVVELVEKYGWVIELTDDLEDGEEPEWFAWWGRRCSDESWPPVYCDSLNDVCEVYEWLTSREGELWREYQAMRESEMITRN